MRCVFNTCAQCVRSFAHQMVVMARRLKDLRGAWCSVVMVAQCICNARAGFENCWCHGYDVLHAQYMVCVPAYTYCQLISIRLHGIYYMVCVYHMAGRTTLLLQTVSPHADAGVLLFELCSEPYG
jgi:hypothetical protein